MGKLRLNNRGASLIEIVATVAIVAISLTTIYSVFDFSLRQNAINQEKTINVNIANGVLNYIQNSDYYNLDSYLYPKDRESYGYVLINELRCSDIYSTDQNICNTVLAPTINNRQFNKDNLQVFLLPYNDTLKLQELKDNPPSEFPQVLNDHIKKIDTSIVKQDNRNIIRIVVIVKSNIKANHDTLIEGVITNED